MLETNNKIKFLVEIHWVTDIPKEQNIRRHRSKIKTLFPTLRCVFCSLQPLARIPESVFFLPATAISSSCYTRCTRETRTGFYGTSIKRLVEPKELTRRSLLGVTEGILSAIFAVVAGDTSRGAKQRGRAPFSPVWLPGLPVPRL